MTGADVFEAFVRRFQDMVFATAVRLLGSPSDAEDVAQGVFLRAFQRFDELRDNPAAPGWLKTATRNACINHLTRYRKRWTFFSELGDDREPAAAHGLMARATRVFEAGRGAPTSTFDPASADDSPAALVERAEDLARLEAALRGLTDAQRVPLVLFHFEEMSYQEIATTLGVSLAKVKIDIFRGREALRKALTDATR
jgi:RNA polymerase sigma-70 factor, ECF subfamily